VLLGLAIAGVSRKNLIGGSPYVKEFGKAIRRCNEQAAESGRALAC
jgi:hypothetical protein